MALTPLTEAEYAAMLPYRMRRIAGVLNVRYAAILPDGMRFEWTAESDGDEP